MSEKQNTQRKIDEFQLAAIDASKNSVVSAGAGSGKTTVLSERFTDLVLNRNCEVDQILTLTFTKKATVEMSSRIYQVLQEKAPDKAKDFYKASIKTLDSYCNSIAKMGCNLYGITPDFTQDEAAITGQISALALPFILEHRDNSAIRALVSTKDYAQIATELFVNPIVYNSTIAEPIDFEKAFNNQKNEIFQAWNEYTKKCNDLFHDLTGALDDFDGNRNSKSIIALTQLLDKGIPEIPEISMEHINNADSKEMEEYVLNSKKILPARVPTGNGTDELKEIIYALRDVTDTLISLCNFVYGCKITKELLPLLEEFQNKANNLKRASGILTFKDISSLATCILRDYPEIRQIEKEKFKAIMIDEFQDNNQMQRDLLFMLAEKLDRHEQGIPEVEDLCPDKLFFVGDEKQSIYRFRGADVSVFNALAKDFQEGNLSMTTNYRSHPSLINAFNIIFGGNPAVFFTEQDEKAKIKNNESIPDYEAIYHNVTFPKDSKESIKKNPEILKQKRIHIARYENETSAAPNQLKNEEAEAQWVAEKIKNLCTVGVNGKIYKPEEIAILLRSYTLQPLFERTLLNHGIPYNTETVTGFFSDGPVNDIFSFLRICIYDRDTISYAQVLRSPFVNLSTAETNAIILLDAKPFEGEVENLLKDESLNRYLHAKAFYEEMKESVKSDSLTKTVSKLWYNAGYRFETMWNQKVSMYSKMYDLIFELAHQSEQSNMSLSAFVDSVRTYIDQSEKLENMDIPMEKASGVHILTIHKSKGLEYEVVFICGTHKKSANDINASPVYSSKEFGITINTPPCPSFAGSKTNYFYNLVAEKNKQMENAELRRLVYVALTRACSELYITNGKFTRTKDSIAKYSPNGTANLDSIYHTLEPVINYFEQTEDENGNPIDWQEKAFFDVETIPPYTIGDEGTVAQGRKNTQEARKILLQSLIENEIYTKAKLINKDEVESKYISPSQLYAEDEESNPEKGLNSFESNETIPFAEINKIVEASIPKKNGERIPNALPRFDFANFGTIAHAYMEAVITGEKATYSNRDINGLENPERDLPKIISVCSQMQDKFKESDLGKTAINSKWHKSEYEFRSLDGDKIVKGIIDLVFQNPDGTYTIVDYKTNQTIQPEIYYSQLACYKKAVAQMKGIEDENSISCYLYYLRYGKAVDITSSLRELSNS